MYQLTRILYLQSQSKALNYLQYFREPRLKAINEHLDLDINDRDFDRTHRIGNLTKTYNNQTCQIQ